jgi:hypothetical protein
MLAYMKAARLWLPRLSESPKTRTEIRKIAATAIR